MLSAIRNAGGSNKKKHLKKKKRKVKQKPKIKCEPTMAEDLTARLNRRAVGMRGGGSKKKGKKVKAKPKKKGKKVKAKPKKKKVIVEGIHIGGGLGFRLRVENDPMVDLAANDSDTSELIDSDTSSEDWD